VPEPGVRQVRLPWAEVRARFTALFERLAIDILKETDIRGPLGSCGSAGTRPGPSSSGPSSGASGPNARASRPTELDEREILKLAPESKHLTDTIKMVAYRAETALVRSLAPHYARTEDEGRALIREMLSSSADLVPDAQRLRIRLHSLANPRSNQALAHVCAILNALEVQYPGTSLTLVYEAPGVA
jgi:hypothetical protein